MKVPISRPFFGEEEARAVADVLRSGWVVQGPRVAEFEARFARYVSGDSGITVHAVATTSCTTALHAALLALGIGAGDEVVVPAFTYVATANAVELAGAKPVFADVDLSTFNARVVAIRQAVTSRTRAIMPVSLFGMPFPVEALKESFPSLPIVEDCACSLGTSSGGVHAGMGATVSAFSLHPRKVITTGEGGMLVTRNGELAGRLRSIRDNGSAASDLERHAGAAPHVMPEHLRLGSNYRMTDIQGAIGCVQMDRLPMLLDARRRLAARYDGLLDFVSVNTQSLRLPLAVGMHSYQSYVTMLESSALRDRVMLSLQERGVATRPGTHAVPTLGYYARKYGYTRSDFPNAAEAEACSLSLPLYPSMTDEEQDYVVASLKAALA